MSWCADFEFRGRTLPRNPKSAHCAHTEGNRGGGFRRRASCRAPAGNRGRTLLLPQPLLLRERRGPLPPPPVSVAAASRPRFSGKRNAQSQARQEKRSGRGARRQLTGLCLRPSGHGPCLPLGGRGRGRGRGRPCGRTSASDPVTCCGCGFSSCPSPPLRPAAASSKPPVTHPYGGGGKGGQCCVRVCVPLCVACEGRGRWAGAVCVHVALCDMCEGGSVLLVRACALVCALYQELLHVELVVPHVGVRGESRPAWLRPTGPGPPLPPCSSARAL